VTEQVFAIESKPLGMILFEKQLVIASMNSTLYSFYLKGKKNMSLHMPAPINDIAKLQINKTQSTSAGQCVIVTLSNGEIRLYSPRDKNLIHILKHEVRVNFESILILFRSQ
jgi:hypothetical protein